MPIILAVECEHLCHIVSKLKQIECLVCFQEETCSVMKKLKEQDIFPKMRALEDSIGSMTKFLQQFAVFFSDKVQTIINQWGSMFSYLNIF